MNYQDEFAEYGCDECGGAGFLGGGPYADPCAACGGTGVIVTDEPLPAAAPAATHEEAA